MIIPWYFILIGSRVANVTSNFKMPQNTRAKLDILSVKNDSSLLKCTQREHCDIANWSQSRCELLRKPVGGILFVESLNSKHICKEISIS